MGSEMCIRDRCRESQFSHYEMSSIYSRRHKQFGVPVIILTSVVSASIFSTFMEHETEWIKYLAIGLSLASIVLSSLQTFMKFSEQADAHKAAAAEYSVIRRKLELMHAQSSAGAADMGVIADSLAALAQKSPNVPDHIFNKVIKKIV